MHCFRNPFFTVFTCLQQDMIKLMRHHSSARPSQPGLRPWRSIVQEQSQVVAVYIAERQNGAAIRFRLRQPCSQRCFRISALVFAGTAEMN